MIKIEKSPVEMAYELGYRQAQTEILQQLLRAEKGDYIPRDKLDLIRQVLNLSTAAIVEVSFDEPVPAPPERTRP